MHAARAGRQALLLRPDVPPRAAAEGPPAPVLADRRRGASAATMPAADAEVLLLLHDLLARPRRRATPRCWSTRSAIATCRPAYRDALVAWGRAHVAELCDDCERRLEQNPLRLLDCKQPGCAAIRDSAPRMVDHLCAPCRAHFDARAASCSRREGVRPRLAPVHGARPRLLLPHRLRGVGRRGSARRTRVGGGGRYDGLVKGLGGPGRRRRRLRARRRAPGDRRSASAPAHAAVRRVRHRAARRRRPRRRPCAWRIACGAPACASRSSRGERSLKSQMRHADKLGARYVVILGEDELAGGRVTVRDMAERARPAAGARRSSATAPRSCAPRWRARRPRGRRWSDRHDARSARRLAAHSIYCGAPRATDDRPRRSR